MTRALTLTWNVNGCHQVLRVWNSRIEKTRIYTRVISENTYEKIIWSRDYVTCLGELLDGLRTICREYALKIWRLCINKLAKVRKPRKHHFPLTSWAISRSSGNLLPRSERYWTSEALIWAIPELELFSCCAGSSSSLAWLFLFFLFFLSEQWYVRWY